MLRIIAIALIITASIIFYSCNNKSNPVNNKIDTTQNNEGNARITFDKNSGSPGNSVDVSVTGIVLGKDTAEIYFGDIQVKIHSSNYFQEETRFYVTIPDSLAKMSKVIFICGDIKGTSKDYFYFYNPKKVKILSFFPEKGSVGTTVIIRADNVNPLENKNYIYFGDKQAVIDSLYIFSSYDYIITKVPEVASTNQLKLVVDNNETISGKSFEVLDPSLVDSSTTKQVIIYDFSPKYGEPESEFITYAKNINPDINKNSVYINNIKAQILSLYPPEKPQVIFAKVPKNAISGKIKLVSGKYSDETLEDFVVTSKNAEFSISDFEPKKGLVGLDVFIYGSGFGNDMNNVKVLFGEIEAQKTSINDTLITCIVPCFAETSQITVIKNNQKITTDDVFIPSRFYSLQVELGNVNVEFANDTISTLFFVPMTEQFQKFKEDPYLKPNEFDFGDYHIKIDPASYLTLELDHIVLTDYREISNQNYYVHYWLYEYDVSITVENIKIVNLDYKSTFTFELSGYDINKYLTYIRCQKFKNNVENQPPFHNDKTKISYLKWDNAIRSDSYLKITIKRCP